MSIHSLHWHIGEYNISVCVSPPIPSVIILISNLTRRVKQADRSWEQNEACILTVFRHADCRCDMCSGGETKQMLFALSPSPHDHSLYWHREWPATSVSMRYAYSVSELRTRDWRLWCMLAENRASVINESQISTLCVSLSVHTLVIPAYQLDHHVACRRRDAFWCLFCLTVTDECLYMACTSSQQSLIHDTPGDCSACQSLYAPNSGCWRNAPVLLQTQLEPGEDSEAEEQTGPPTKRQRVDAQPDSSSVLTPVWTSFSRRLINDNWKKSNFWFRESNIRKKRF